ncbi:hypothetical protein GCM10027402_20400 [Arthrobacter monumenti]
MAAVETAALSFVLRRAPLGALAEREMGVDWRWGLIYGFLVWSVFAAPSGIALMMDAVNVAIGAYVSDVTIENLHHICHSTRV